MFCEHPLFSSGGGASLGGINVPSVVRLGSINTRYQRGYSSVSSSCSSTGRLRTSSCGTMGSLQRPYRLCVGSKTSLVSPFPSPCDSVASEKLHVLPARIQHCSEQLRVD